MDRGLDAERRNGKVKKKKKKKKKESGITHPKTQRLIPEYLNPSTYFFSKCSTFHSVKVTFQ